MRVRRLILLGVSLMLGVMAAIALLSPVPPVSENRAATGGAGAGPQDPERSPRAQDRHPEGEAPLVVSAQESGQALSAPAGRQVIVEVRTEAPVTVQVGEDGPIEVAEPEAPAEFAVFVEEDLSAAITLVEEEREIGRLTAERPGR